MSIFYKVSCLFIKKFAIDIHKVCTNLHFDSFLNTIWENIFAEQRQIFQFLHMISDESWIFYCNRSSCHTHQLSSFPWDFWRIFLPHMFYVKSILEALNFDFGEVLQFSKLKFLKLKICQNWFHVKSEWQKNCEISTLWIVAAAVLYTREIRVNEMIFLMLFFFLFFRSFVWGAGYGRCRGLF